MGLRSCGLSRGRPWAPRDSVKLPLMDAGFGAGVPAWSRAGESCAFTEFTDEETTLISLC